MSDTNEPSLLDLPLTTFLDRLAARKPTPGGGAVAGAAGALACALGQMVAAYSIGKKTEDDHRAIIEDAQPKLRRADAIMRQLLDEDAQAYAAYRQVSQPGNTEAATQELKAQALILAMTIPLSIAATAADTLTILLSLAPVAGKYMLSDLEASAILAEATVRCAGCSVRVNADILPDRAIAEKATNDLSQIQTSATNRLEEILGILDALRAR